MTIRIPEKLEFLQLLNQTGRATTGQVWFDQTTQTFKTRENNGNASYLQSKGNQVLLATLNGPAATLEMYVSASGSDDLDGYGLTTSHPFLTLQRAFNEIPNNAQGHVRINLLGAGPFENFVARDYESLTQLFIYVIGDTTSPVESFTLPAANAQPSNPSGGQKHGILEYSVGAYSTLFGDGTHWIKVGDIGGDAFTTFGLGMASVIDGYASDGYRSVSPNIRILNTVDYGSFLSSPPAIAYQYVSIVDNSGWGCFAPDDGNFGEPKIFFVGCIVSPSFGAASINIGYMGCKMPGGYYDASTNSTLAFSNWYDSSASVCVTMQRGLSSGLLNGIYKKGVQYSPSFGTISGVFRGLDADNYALKLGSHIGVAGTSACGVEVDFSDFEMGSGNCIKMNWANSRMCNGDGISVDGYVSTFLTIQNHSFAEVNARVYGTTTSTPFLANNISNMIGITNFSSGAPLVQNSSASTQNIVVGDAGTFDYADLPQTDLATLVRVE